MRLFTTIICTILFVFYSAAQAYEGSTEYNKKKQSAIVIDYSYSPEAVEGAFVDKLDRMGLEGKQEKGLFNSSKGFRIYKNSVISDISSSGCDYIVKVDQKGRKGTDEATLYLIINKDGNNILDSHDDETIEKAKSFLNNLTPEIDAFSLELKIKDQEVTIAKAQKKLKDLEDDQENMEKKIKKLQSDLEQNAKDQENQQKEIEKQKQILETLKGKRTIKE
jgi:hypothetical protein